MNTISLSCNTQIQIESGDLITANAPFFHINRIAPFHVMIYCIKGCVYVAEDGVDYAIGAGEILLLKRGHHQTPTAEIEEGTSWIYVHFFTHEIEIESAKDFNCIGASEVIEIPQYVINLKNSHTEQLLYKFVNEIHLEDAISKLRIPSLFHDVLLSLYLDSMKPCKPKLYEEIQSYLNEHLRESITSKDLEKQFHLTYKYMEHVFKENLGISIMQYHTKLRIRESSKLLRSTSHSILQISLLLGFRDQLYFSRCFKKHMGMSPREYRMNQMIL